MGDESVPDRAGKEGLVGWLTGGWVLCFLWEEKGELGRSKGCSFS